MQQIKQLQDWITHDKETNIRKPNCRILRSIESNELAKELALSIVKISMSDVPTTSIAGSLGKSILSGLELLSKPEKEINQTRIDCGLQLIRILIENDILTHYRSKEDKHQYMVGVKDDEFIDAIVAYIPAASIPAPSQPCYGKPMERTTFADETAGDLVRKINYKNVQEYKYGLMPIAYNVINKQQYVPYTVNTALLEVFKQTQDDALFTNTNKNMNAEQRRGISRDNNMVLDIATAIGDREFHVYHYYDFRGRLYAAINYFSFIGSKLAKSMYYFGNKKELGIEGWNWLLFHAANCWGFDKAPIDNRITFSEDNLDGWMECAKDPVGNRSWTHADDPYGFLAALLEIKAALCSTDKFKFKSGLPVAFDQSCSGLGWLSGLSLNEVTGALCNVSGKEVIGDYYLFIADILWQNPDLPQVFKDKYDDRRTIVKRSCMTYFYSCGKRTMGEHVFKDHSANYADFTQENCSILGELIFNTCKTQMTGPSSLMKLFIDAGMNQAKKRKDLKLIMPYNAFPLIQSYRNHHTALTEITIKGKRIQLRYVSEKSKFINKRDVITGSSPNIIHALDAQLVAKVINETGYDIMSIHDSFSCCPADAGKLFEDTRRCFVELLSENVLEELMVQIDCEHLLDDIDMGNMVIEEALDNEYLFS